MNRHEAYLPVLLIILSAAVPTGVSAGQHGGALPPSQDAAPRVALRAKTVAVGAELAEKWSAVLGTALSRFSASPTVRNEIALAHQYYTTGILDQAYEHYQAVARRVPSEAAAWDGQARIWRDWGYPGLGLGDAHRAVWADPRSPIARNTLGTILYLLGKHQDAVEQFTRAVTLDPSAAYAYYNLALAHINVGQYQEAAGALDRATTLDPSLDAARVRARAVEHQAMDVTVGKGGSHERR